MHQLLHIEAAETVRRAVEAALAEGPLPFNVTARAALTGDLAAAPPPDAVLLGVATGGDPAAAIASCRAVFAAAPIVVLTEAADLAFARTALRAGAHDVVTQSERALAVLSRILVYAIERGLAESRGRILEQTAANLARLLDALIAAPSEAVVQTDAAGTIERLSPAAADLLGLDPRTAIGTGLAEHLPWSERPQLAAMLETASGTEPLRFAAMVGDTRRPVELEPFAIADLAAEGPRLFKVSEVEADFATDPGEPESAPARPDEPAGAAERATAAVAPGTAAMNEHERRQQAMPDRQDREAPKSVARDQPLAAVPEEGGPRARALVEGLARTAVWRCGKTTGNEEVFGFLAADAASTEALAALHAASAEDAELAVAVDALQLSAWKTIAASAPNSLPKHLALEVSYVTAANRPHFEQLQAEIAKLPPALAKQLVLTLNGVPKGIYVPTLAKTIRAMGTDHGKPALHITEPEADYRSLTFSHLTLVVMDVADLKRALAKDGKQVAALLERMRREACRSVVRGATGALAEALRSRLGIDMTTAL